MHQKSYTGNSLILIIIWFSLTYAKCMQEKSSRQKRKLGDVEFVPHGCNCSSWWLISLFLDSVWHCLTQVHLQHCSPVKRELQQCYFLNFRVLCIALHIWDASFVGLLILGHWWRIHSRHLSCGKWTKDLGGELIICASHNCI